MLKRSLMSSGVLHFLISSATCIPYMMASGPILHKRGQILPRLRRQSWFFATILVWCEYGK
jgi:hypothetical protein